MWRHVCLEVQFCSTNVTFCVEFTKKRVFGKRVICWYCYDCGFCCLFLKSSYCFLSLAYAIFRIIIQFPPIADEICTNSQLWSLVSGCDIESHAPMWLVLKNPITNVSVIRSAAFMSTCFSASGPPDPHWAPSLEPCAFFRPQDSSNLPPPRQPLPPGDVIEPNKLHDCPNINTLYR